jgi:hypothetical protein
MILGFKWRGLSDDDKATLLDDFRGAGFARVTDGEETGPAGDRLWFHYGDDMLIIDLEEDRIYTGDWGTYTDLEVGIDYVRSLNERFGPLRNTAAS